MDVPEYYILPTQDILGMGTESRINVPSTINNINWTFRLNSMDGLLDRADWLREMLKKEGC